MSLKRLALILVVSTLAACSDPYGTGGGGGGGHLTTITVSNNFFSPTPDTVAAGTVTFSWSNAGNTHNVTWDSGPTTPANSSTMSTGTFPVSLSQGTYHYHCTVHGAAMSGTIVVQ
ncbi:MAG TPA: cupredoxin domain-containing protein [Gemmatimonadales bacterium]|jgi:plastocyanin|nr:cupredoxin domain-containing protein [Gemmatimonadales bacterium]